jgi:hypothetical protein
LYDFIIIYISEKMQFKSYKINLIKNNHFLYVYVYGFILFEIKRQISNYKFDFTRDVGSIPDAIIFSKSC